jgi:4-amino-4-deoxy-L-arabinose transferase-like glycosyltransferase
MLSKFRKADIVFNPQPWLIGICFVCLVVLLRWSTFYQSVISWDESLYLLVAEAWTEGNPPYTAIWDNKPPGIYAIFAIAISVLGHSVFSIRVAACLFIGMTCFFLYKIGNLIKHRGQEIGLLAGSLYAISTLTNGGMAANTEVFYATFVAIAAYLFFSTTLHEQLSSPALSSKYYLKLLLTGLLLGIGFEVKQVVLFDFFALSLVLGLTIVFQSQANSKYWLLLKALIVLFIGFISPFVIVTAYFWLTGFFNEYLYANFTANKLRTVNLKFSFTPIRRAIVYQVKSNLFFWFSIPATIIYLLLSKTKPVAEKWLIFSFITWFFVVLCCICSVFRGYLYVHYFLQLAPALCLITAYLLINLTFPKSSPYSKVNFKDYIAFWVTLFALLASTAMFEALKLGVSYAYATHVKGLKHWQDTPALIAEYLKPRVKPDDYIYVVEHVPIVYFLVNAKIPTRYAFPSFLLARPDLPNITGTDPVKELDDILQKQPIYIIKPKEFVNLSESEANKSFITKLNQNLDQHYEIETSVHEFDLHKFSRP